MNLEVFCICCAVVSLITFVTCGESSNLAFGKFTLDNSKRNNTSYGAVDGKYDLLKNCFVSSGLGKQWLTVNLIWSYKLSAIVVHTNDTNYKLTTGIPTSLSSPISAATKYCSENSTQANRAVCFLCFNYVSSLVFVAQFNQVYLVVCELEVFGAWAEPMVERQNLLLGKNAFMLSTWSENVSSEGIDFFNGSRATDGIRDPNPRNGFCARTNEITYIKNWLVVDMERNYVVDYVALTYSRNSSDIASLNKVVIGLSSTKSPVVFGKYPLCATYDSSVMSGNRAIIKCSAALPAYRYLIVQQSPNPILGPITICELEAYEAIAENGALWQVRYIRKRFSDSMFERIFSISQFHCIMRCSKLGPNACDSIAFFVTKNICQLNSHRTGLTTADNAALTTAWVVYMPQYVSSGNL